MHSTPQPWDRRGQLRRSIHPPLPRRRALRRLVVAAGGTLSAATAVALYVVDRITRASKMPAIDDYSFTPYELGLDWEVVGIPTPTGAALSGWWLPRPESSRVIVCCYGYRGRKADLLGVSAALWRRGYNVLLFDYRGHGDDAGSRVTLGYREVQDALAAMEFALARIPGARLGSIGYSMGAAVAIMAAARDTRIEAVVADSPFAAQRNPIKLRLRQTFRMGWSGAPILYLADHLLQLRLGYRFRDVEPLREIGKLAGRPLLLIHGLADSVIDADDSRALYAAAAEPKELWLIPSVEHCGGYFLDRPAYVSRVADFFDRTLDTPAERSAFAR